MHTAHKASYDDHHPCHVHDGLIQAAGLVTQQLNHPAAVVQVQQLGLPHHLRTHCCHGMTSVWCHEYLMQHMKSCMYSIACKAQT